MLFQNFLLLASFAAGATVTKDDCYYVAQLWNKLSSSPKTFKNCCDPNNSLKYGITCVNNRITEITWRNKNLKGQIPDGIKTFKSLTSLTLAGNQLTGNVPSALGDLTNLKLLNLGSNQIGGAIPNSFCNLTKLEYLILGDNQLKGTFTKALTALKSLKTLDLNKNLISGSIPTQIKALVSVEILQLDRNDFVGPLPAEIGQLPKLSNLYIANNARLLPPTNIQEFAPHKPAYCSFPEKIQFFENAALKSFLNKLQRLVELPSISR